MKHTKTLSKFCIALGVLALFLISMAAYGGPKVDRSGVIDCYHNRFLSLGETNPATNEVFEDKKMIWFLFGEKNEIVEVKFKPSTEHPECKGTSPFDPSKQLKKTIGGSYKLDKLESGNVKQGMAPPTPGERNCYTYEFTCSMHVIPYTETSKSTSTDPIIEVPK